jgi:hypothetical protein
MSGETWNFEQERKRWPEHWESEKGWPAIKSTWRSRLFPHLRVRVLSSGERDVKTIIFWDGDPDGLRRLFTHEPAERWDISGDGLVHTPQGIGPPEDGGEVRLWRDVEELLEVVFERPHFGGPDTWHSASGKFEALPFFEPIPDWDERR